MSRKVINVVSKNQFKILNFSPIYSKIQQVITSETGDNIYLTEQEVLEIYGVESLSEIYNENFIQCTMSHELDDLPGAIETFNLISIGSSSYQSNDLENFISSFRVYNHFVFIIEATSFKFVIAIIKDEVEETEDIKNLFLLQKV